MVALLICSGLMHGLLLCGTKIQAQSTGAPPTNAKRRLSEFVPGEILVRFRSDTVAKREERAATPLTLVSQQIPVSVEPFEGSRLVEGLRLARVSPEDTLPAIEALKARADVLYAEPNYILRKSAIPNDPRFPEMYALKNTGQDGGQAGADIGAEQAWNITTGSRNVVVGVIDEGIDINHPDLRDNIWVNSAETPQNGIDDDGNGLIDDVHGWDFFHDDATVFDGAGDSSNQTDAHGTHVAGTIGATGNNGVGVVGVNWQVSLMSLKVLGPDGGSLSTIIKAYEYAKKMRDLWASSGGTKGANIRVLNNSYSGTNFSQAQLDAIRALNTSGILFVAAAGNDATDNNVAPRYPANADAPNVIAVASMNRSNSLSSFSNYGSQSVHIGAPGSSILSTTPNDTYSVLSGTSMAAPHVAGVAALICAANPDIPLLRLRAALIYSGNPNYSLALNTLTGTTLNALSALQSAVENDLTPPGTVGALSVAAQAGRRVTVSWIASGDDGTAGRASLYYLSFVDAATGEQFLLSKLRPEPSGERQQVTVNIPYRHAAGTLKMQAFDNVGNEGVPASIGVTVPQIASNPYEQSTTSAGALSTGGTPLHLNGDDRYAQQFGLPFIFPFYDFRYSSVTVSTNGALYFDRAPTRPVDPQNPLEIGADATGSSALLNRYRMIAGLWDDLRTDRRAGDDVYVVQPDPDRVIFRWQAETYDGELPVNFEIELRRDGTILTRYGDGNTNLSPVVGISGGEPDAYVASTHTSESSLISLANAPTVNFTLSPCSYGITPTTGSSDGSSIYSTIDIVTGVNCPWTATSNASWITFNDIYGSGNGVTMSGSGNRTLLYTVPANTSGAPRTGTITVAGQTFTVTQANGCAYALSRSSDNISAAGGVAAYVNVSTSLGCPWTATSNASWLSVGDGMHIGADVIVYVAAPNPGAAERTGTMTIAGQTFTVTQGGTNPIDGAQFFVDRHYRDFLGRTPDAGGLQYWSEQITGNANNNPVRCATGDRVCENIRRISVSAAFFVENEFQRTGGFVYRFYKASYGTRPTFAQFNADRALVPENSQLEQNQQAFASQWVQRPEFIARYPASLNTGEAFVDAVLLNVLQNSGVDLSSQRSDLINAYHAGGRAQVVRSVADNATFAAAEFNRAFVLMQYFGYLRRDPDPGGYDFWLDVLNNRVPNNFRAMVCAFLTSTEYQQRFGSTVTRTNNDCAVVGP